MIGKVLIDVESWFIYYSHRCRCTRIREGKSTAGLYYFVDVGDRGAFVNVLVFRAEVVILPASRLSCMEF